MKKDILQRRYRRLVSCSQEQCEKMIRQCLRNSTTVNTKLLNLGINISVPTKRPEGPEGFNKEYLLVLLEQYVTDPNHAEALFIGYDNQRYDIYISDKNTRWLAYPPNIVQNGTHYYWREGSQPQSPINLIGHTHFGNDTIPTSVDSMANRLPGVRYVIYINGQFKEF